MDQSRSCSAYERAREQPMSIKMIHASTNQTPQTARVLSMAQATDKYFCVFPAKLSEADDKGSAEPGCGVGK